MANGYFERSGQRATPRRFSARWSRIAWQASNSSCFAGGCRQIGRQVGSQARLLPLVDADQSGDLVQQVGRQEDPLALAVLQGRQDTQGIQERADGVCLAARIVNDGKDQGIDIVVLIGIESHGEILFAGGCDR